VLFQFPDGSERINGISRETADAFGDDEVDPARQGI